MISAVLEDAARSRYGDQNDAGDDGHHDQQFHQGKAIGPAGTMRALAAERISTFHGIDRLMQAANRRPVRQNPTTLRREREMKRSENSF
jgi:hypothetical protein